MGILDTSAKLHHESVLPSDITYDSAVQGLHDHEVFIKMDPHLLSYERVECTPPMPDTKAYKVIDKAGDLPKAIWSGEVRSEVSYTDLPNGMRSNMKATMGLVMDTSFVVEERDGQLVMVEDNDIKCSRLLMPIVKSQCEGGWKKNHARFVESVKEKQGN